MFKIIYEYYKRFFITEIPVPNNWFKFKDINGKSYYYCKTLNYSQWQHPCLHFFEISKKY